MAFTIIKTLARDNSIDDARLAQLRENEIDLEVAIHDVATELAPLAAHFSTLRAMLIATRAEMAALEAAPR